MGAPHIYTTIWFGLRTNKKMVGVYHFPVYMQTIQIYRTHLAYTPGHVYINHSPLFFYAQNHCTIDKIRICLNSPYTNMWRRPGNYPYGTSLKVSGRTRREKLLQDSWLALINHCFSFVWASFSLWPHSWEQSSSGQLNTGATRFRLARLVYCRAIVCLRYSRYIGD